MNTRLIKTFYVIKEPKNGRKSYAILEEKRSSTSRTYKTLKLESLKAINKAIKDNRYTNAEALILVREVVTSLYKELERQTPKVVHNSENFNLLEEFWNAEYDHRDLIDYDSPKNDFKRAIDTVGALSLYSATREELQKEISKHVKGTKQRRVVARLNTVLKFIKRDIKLRKDKSNQVDVKYLSLDEFNKVLQYIDNEDIKLIFRLSYFTGARTGELFAFEERQYKSPTITIQKQIDRSNNKRDTKNRMTHKAWIFPEGRQLLTKWFKFEKKMEFRNLKFADIIKKACKRAFPENKEKWCCFHDLRHSYAINLLSKGVSLSLVAQSLGNSVTVCQKHYAGFILSDESIDAIENKMNG